MSKTRVSPIWFFLLVLLLVNSSYGVTTLHSMRCTDSAKTCVEGESEKIINGISIRRSCWRWEWNRVCDVPSEDNCDELERRLKADGDIYDMDQNNSCLVQDSEGNCVNQRREFFIGKWQDVKDSLGRKLRSDGRLTSVDSSGGNAEICNLINKDLELMDYDGSSEFGTTAGALKSAEGMKEFAHLNDLSKLQTFAAHYRSCSIKILNFSNCCNGSGWGKSLGASCKEDQKILWKERGKGKCIYVGGTKKRYIKRQHYCCFKNKLEKIIRQAGIDQLGLDLGSGEAAHCRGLTPYELSRLDFNKIDFSEYIAEVLEKMKLDTMGGNITNDNFQKKIIGETINKERILNALDVMESDIKSEEEADQIRREEEIRKLGGFE